MKKILRRRLRCRGAVQGVGFRPWIYRMATELGVAGFILNAPDGVCIEIEGNREAVELFLEKLESELPPLARLDSLEIEKIPAEGSSSFEVRTSKMGRRKGALVPPDAAICPDCRREMEDPADRRFHYAFCGCASCGPRFSLARTLPYDRSRTTMSCFELCPHCREEYETPSDRRFHTEPVCCPQCGPKLRFLRPGGEELDEEGEALRAAARLLAEGGILALKGLGGFQLSCRADSPEVVAELRRRKRRPSKAFALMAPDLEAARRLVDLRPEDEELMLSFRSPIILAPRKAGIPIADEVAPGLAELGLMLPTTPLHLELYRAGAPEFLVMTSGNVSDEPIVTGNREAIERLGMLADAFLLHDRDIARRVDDSVCRSTPQGPMLMRRSRGWIPEGLPLPVKVEEPVLALGAYLQNTACFGLGEEAWPSQHVGDLESVSARVFLREVAEGLEDFFDSRSRLLLRDLHPDYASSWLAEELARVRGGRARAFQHHLSHLAATLGEHQVFPEPGERVLGIALDGTGLGTDATAWGGEWLELDGDLNWRRRGGLSSLPLIGGEQAVREPWRIVVAALEERGGGDLLDALPMKKMVDPVVFEGVRRLAGSAWPQASGAGRLFEAMGALLGLVTTNRWEGEAAVRLEALAARHAPVPPWEELSLEESSIPADRMIEAAARRLIAGEDAAAVARGFHSSFSALSVELALRLLPEGAEAVALGGGVWINRLLLEESLKRFEQKGIRILFPRRLPPGDGAIAYGQVVLASLELGRGGEWREG